MIRFRLGALIGLIAISFVCVPAAHARTTLEDAAAYKKLHKQIKNRAYGRPNKKGEGIVPNLSQLEAPPKKIALVSFYVVDTGKGEGTYYASVRTFDFLTQDGASHFATNFYDAGFAALKEEFAKQNMEVLTPKEFLTDDTKKQAYLDFKLEYSFAVKMALGFINGMARGAAGGNELTTSAVAPGYRFFPTHQTPNDPKMVGSLDALRKSLGVDGVMIVSNHTSSSRKEVLLKAIQMNLYASNPTPKKEGKFYIQYKDTQLYYDTLLNLKKPGWIATFKKKNISEENYDGYDALIRAASKGAIDYMVEKISDK